MRVLPSSPSALLVLLLVALLVLPLGAPAAGQASPTVHSPLPRPDAVVQPGTVRVGATVAPAGDARLLVDGTDVGPALPDGVDVDLVPGTHTLAVTAGGTTLRQWQVYTSGVTTRVLSQDRVAVADAAAGGRDGSRPVLLVNPDRPLLAATAGPLAVATRAVVVPVAMDRVDEAAMAAIAAARGPGAEVMLLGGLDAIGTEVADQVEAAGWHARRIGTGSPADVAVAAAVHQPAADVYTRGGEATPRPVLVAPDGPAAATLQAAANAARRGAALLLAGPDGLSPATAEVIGGRPLVLLAEDLTDAAAAAVTAAADPDAVLARVPRLPEAAKEVWIADAVADPAAAVLATRAAGLGAAVLVDVDDAPAWVGRNRPAGATVMADGPTPAAVGSWWVDGPQAPQVAAVLTQGGVGDPLVATTPVVELRADRPVSGAAVYATVAGREWPGTTSIDDDVVTWTAGPRPALAQGEEPTGAQAADLELTAVVTAQGHLRHTGLRAEVVIGPATTTSPEGFVVAGGSSPVVGAGPLRTFSIEVEPSTGLDLAAVAAEAEGILLDPTRGWTARGQRSMQRVGSAAEADIRVVVATPSTVDRFCGRVGLDTAGRLSCWDGRRAMLNLTRWNTGVSPFHTDLTVYRQYLVSHEVGHGLGMGHVGCPADGALAPVMMQQSKSLGGCVANGWPYPHG